jgi:hypothetical protein
MDNVCVNKYGDPAGTSYSGHEAKILKPEVVYEGKK